MASKSQVTAVFAASFLLLGCGGGGESGGIASGSGTLAYTELASRLGTLSVDANAASFTPDATINTQSNTVSYRGVANIGVGDASYLGDLRMSVNFANDSFSGSGGGFYRYFSTVANSANGTRVSGSMSMTGRLTGDNESSIGSGLDGRATGSVEGRTIDMDIEGNLTGLTPRNAILYFSARTGRGGGVGYVGR